MIEPMFEWWLASRETPESAALLDRVREAGRAEARAELAASARLVPLIPPSGAEDRYIPSAALADFVRCRDLTCRAPGCDRPATDCDLDHTVPYADGGPTHASNLKALCRCQQQLREEHLTSVSVARRLRGSRLRPGGTRGAG